MKKVEYFIAFYPTCSSICSFVECLTVYLIHHIFAVVDGNESDVSGETEPSAAAAEEEADLSDDTAAAAGQGGSETASDGAEEVRDEETKDPKEDL